jgi:hypothetical protein
MNGEPLKIRCGEREVPVEAAPVAKVSSSHRTHALIHPHPQLLVLCPSPGFGVAGRGIILTSVLVGAIAGLGLATCGGWTPLIILGVCALTALVGLLVLLLPRTHVFDLERGMWVTRGLFANSAQPLHEVLAVQMNLGGPMGGQGRGGPTFELNLVLQGEPLRRRCLTCHADPRSTWQIGKYLSQTLKVPFLEHKPPRPATAVPPLAPASPPAPPAYGVGWRTFGWIFAVLGTVLLTVGVALTAWSFHFFRSAERAEGMVISLVAGGKGSMAPVVQYQVEGKAYTYRSHHYSSPPAFRVGEKTTVLYRPEDPGAGMILSFFEMWGAGLLFTMLGAIFALIGFGFGSGRRVPAAPPWPSPRPAAPSPGSPPTASGPAPSAPG